MSWEQGRLSYLTGARIDAREVLGQVDRGERRDCTRAEVLEALDDVNREIRKLRRRCPPPAPAPQGRALGRGRPAAPDRNRRKTMKSLFGAVIIGADVIGGMAAKPAFASMRLHHAPYSHQFGAYAFYGALFLLTLWVIGSAISTLRGGQAKPEPQRPVYRMGPR